MGLTIHFDLTTPPDTDASRAHEMVRQMRRRAQTFKHRGRVDDVLPICNDREALRWAEEYRSVPHPRKPWLKSGIDIPAEEGWMFFVKVGEDCEPLRLALCRYPKTVVMGGKRYRTQLPGWRFHGFSKTQYASLHGWEHFLRCHKTVIDLLLSLRSLGLLVSISDEGEYWPGRSVDALRRNVGQMNALVAAAAGAMKDAFDGVGIESPIFAHKNFERLEAEGESQAGERIRQASDEVSRFLRASGK